MAKMKCRFCNRKIPPTKYVRHSCLKKKEARGYHEAWKFEHRDDPGTITQYPTFEAFDRAILDGNLVYAPYPYAPPGLQPPSHGWEDVGDGESDGEDGFGNEGIVIEQGTEWTKPNDNVVSPNTNWGGLIRPSEQDSETEDEEGEDEESGDRTKPLLKATAEKFTAGVMTVAESVKITTREKSWLPIVAGVHEFIMWAFEAKDRKQYFKLTRNQKKILTASYQATLGDSPLMKLKTTGTGEYDVHIAVANIEVYGEFMMTNFDGALNRGQGVWAKWKARSEKKRDADVQAQEQENQ